MGHSVTAQSWLNRTVWLLKKKRKRKKERNHARNFHVITHALSLMRVTPRLASSQLLRATQSCWYKLVEFRQWNININGRLAQICNWFSKKYILICTNWDHGETNSNPRQFR
jgi:hypothetical protein